MIITKCDNSVEFGRLPTQNNAWSMPGVIDVNSGLTGPVIYTFTDLDLRVCTTRRTNHTKEAQMVTVLLLLGFVCFVIAAFAVPVPRVNLVALGLAFWILVPLLTALGVG